MKSTRRNRIAFIFCLSLARLLIAFGVLSCIAGIVLMSQTHRDSWSWYTWWKDNGIYVIFGSGVPIGLLLQHLIKISWPTENPGVE